MSIRQKVFHYPILIYAPSCYICRRNVDRTHLHLGWVWRCSVTSAAAGECAPVCRPAAFIRRPAVVSRMLPSTPLRAGREGAGGGGRGSSEQSMNRADMELPPTAAPALLQTRPRAGDRGSRSRWKLRWERRPTRQRWQGLGQTQGGGEGGRIVRIQSTPWVLQMESERVMGRQLRLGRSQSRSHPQLPRDLLACHSRWWVKRGFN